GAVPQLGGDPLDRAVLGTELGPQGPDHPHRCGLLFRAVATRGRLPRGRVLRHEYILVSKRWRLQPTQCDSSTRITLAEARRAAWCATTRRRFDPCTPLTNPSSVLRSSRASR